MTIHLDDVSHMTWLASITFNFKREACVSAGSKGGNMLTDDIGKRLPLRHFLRDEVPSALLPVS